jgi:heme exporter protein C
MGPFRNWWWKFAGLALLFYVVAGGFLFDVPQLPVVRESIRNIYFHVGMWFSMMFILAVSLVFSMRYLRHARPEDDLKALAAVKTGLVFGFLGLLTGMVWAHFTWGRFWVNDPKLNGAVVGLLAYLAYLVLRGSVEGEQKRGRLAAVYNLFAFVLYFVFIMILPRLGVSSIHPGTDGNPALATGDLDPAMRKVFFPAIMAWFIMAWWVFTVFCRIDRLRYRVQELLENEPTWK